MERSRDSRLQLGILSGALGLGGLALVLFFTFHLGAYVRGIFVSIVAPHQALNAYAGLSKDALIERLTATDSELSRIKYQALLYGILADENTALRKLANAATVSPGLTARVIVRPPQTSYDTLIIDLGKDAGVKENDFATYHGIALGRVTAVDAQSATVSLFSTSGKEQDAILGEPRAVAVARGLGGGAFELSVPHDVTVAAGDAVMFPGTESLILGIVTSISAEARDASKVVHFASPLSFAELDFIRIVSNP